MILTNATLATMADGAPYGLVPKGAIVVTDGMIDWVGPAADLPTGSKDHETTDLEGRLVTPGLIDCHTHLVHAGNRAREFEMGLQGASYEEIARAGGASSPPYPRRATRARDSSSKRRSIGSTG